MLLIQKTNFFDIFGWFQDTKKYCNLTKEDVLNLTVRYDVLYFHANVPFDICPKRNMID